MASVPCGGETVLRSILCNMWLEGIGYKARKDCK